MGSGTCWIANKQDEDSTKEIISICSSKENCHIRTPFNFCRYALSPCLPSNTQKHCNRLYDAADQHLSDVLLEI